MSGAILGKPTERENPLYWSDRPNWYTVRDGKWKAHMRQNNFMLFDLSKDPSESNNLASEFPQLTRKYRQLLEDWNKVIHQPQ